MGSLEDPADTEAGSNDPKPLAQPAGKTSWDDTDASAWQGYEKKTSFLEGLTEVGSGLQKPIFDLLTPIFSCFGLKCLIAPDKSNGCCQCMKFVCCAWLTLPCLAGCRELCATYCSFCACCNKYLLCGAEDNSITGKLARRAADAAKNAGAGAVIKWVPTGCLGKILGVCSCEFLNLFCYGWCKVCRYTCPCFKCCCCSICGCPSSK